MPMQIYVLQNIPSTTWCMHEHVGDPAYKANEELPTSSDLPEMGR